MFRQIKCVILLTRIDPALSKVTALHLTSQTQRTGANNVFPKLIKATGPNAKVRTPGCLLWALYTLMNHSFKRVVGDGCRRFRQDFAQHIYLVYTHSVMLVIQAI